MKIKDLHKYFTTRKSNDANAKYEIYLEMPIMGKPAEKLVYFTNDEWGRMPEIFFYSLVFAKNSVNTCWHMNRFSYLGNILNKYNLPIYDTEAKQYSSMFTKFEIRYITDEADTDIIDIPSFADIFDNIDTGTMIVANKYESYVHNY